MKTRHRRTTKATRKLAPISARRSHSPAADLQEQLDRRTSELDEAQAHQIATSEVLSVISRSPADAQPVFDAIVESAARLCGTIFSVIYLYDDGRLRIAASKNFTPQAINQVHALQELKPPVRSHGAGRAILDRTIIHVPDVLADPEYSRELALAGGWRAVLSIPLLREGKPVGALSVAKAEPIPFSDRQIQLLNTFADQALIAIENVRLFTETKEALGQQTATSDVLKVISSSPGELGSVFNAMLENATRICEAKFGTLYLCENDGFRAVSIHNAPPAYAQARAAVVRPHRDSSLWRAANSRQAVQVEDVTKLPGYIEGDPFLVSAVAGGGYRTVLSVPMLKEGDVVGVICIYRQEPRPFTDKQISLVQNFAAQAVIAIENTRLLNELRQRTTDLTESLEQQTATSEVLNVISSSPGELGPVFQSMLEKATQLCEASFGSLLLLEGDSFRRVARYNTPAKYADFSDKNPLIHYRPSYSLNRLVETKQAVHVSDMMVVEPEVPITKFGNARTLVAVPMLKENELVGAIGIYRQEVRPFTDKQIALVQSFASQAVIAIENARLLNELRQSLQQQTATADVLKIISRSTFDLRTVLQTLVESAARLCDADKATITRERDGAFYSAEAYGFSREFMDYIKNIPIEPERGSASGRALLEGRVIHIPDVKADPEYTWVETQRRGDYRTILCVPMLREGVPIGVLILTRSEARPFTDKQIELVTTFADQAAIAIENVRLFEAEQERTRELSDSLQQQTATADVLKVISRSTFDLQTVFDTLVQSAARLCRADKANMFRLVDGKFRYVAGYGFPSEYAEYVRSLPTTVHRGSVIGRAVFDAKTVHIRDVLADPEFTVADAQKRGEFRTALGVPLMREGTPIGAFFLSRANVEPFTQQQIDLVTTFADQAVIAIENVRLFNEIQAKSRELAEASQHKSQFLANMSHELRTPLNAILGYTELMTDGAYGEPSEKMLGILKRLEANGRHLLGLINDVLDLSKIEAGQLVLELSDYTVQDIAQTVRSTLEPLAADKKLAFKVEMSSELPPGRGDGRRLTQVLINLVGNAIKFTDAGEVAIKAEANNGAFYVSVRDTGPGISAADQTRLFQEFQQADNAITRKKGGTGLGLAISKRIIEMHGGRIWVESQPGQGSTFAFTLPVVVEQQVNVEPK